MISIIRRLDLDADARLSKAEFIQGLKPEEPYSKHMRRSASKKRVTSNNRLNPPAFSNQRRPSNISGYKFKPDNLINFSNDQTDVIRTHALDRSYRKQSAGKSPLKMRPNMKDTDDFVYTGSSLQAKAAALSSIRISTIRGGKNTIKPIKLDRTPIRS